MWGGFSLAPETGGDPVGAAYWKSAEFWNEGDPPKRTLTTNELAERYGEVTAKGWETRRNSAKSALGDAVAWEYPLAGQHRDNGQALTYGATFPVDRTEMMRALKAGATIEGLCDHFDVGPSRIRAAISQLRTEHVLVDEVAAGFILSDRISAPVEDYRIDTAQFAEQEFCFGVTADNHIGSKYERLDVLEDLADRWKAYGASRVLVAGNWIDGSGRKFNQHDIYVHGVEEQVGNYLDKLPVREGLDWDVLSGDDHEGWFVQDCHVNIGHALEDEAIRRGRLDVHDLGYMERDIELVQPGGSAILRVLHAGGGTAYAISYTAQKYVESLQGGEKPKVAILGHYHKYDTGYPREVHTIQPGCTQDQTPFMRKKKIPAHVGGVTLWLRQNELGIITSLKVEWMPYYDRQFYAYQWRKAVA